MPPQRSNKVWDARQVQALRRYLTWTQTQMARELGVRQQTVSEWETGVYQPRGASRKLLSLVAERAGFTYRLSEAEGGGEQPRA